MSELTVSAELARILDIEITTEKTSSEIVVEQVESFCKMRHLSERATLTCINAALAFHYQGRSVAWCVSVGCQKAFQMFPITPISPV